MRADYEKFWTQLLTSRSMDHGDTGIVLYDGTQALSFGERLWAVPLGRL